MELDTLNVRLLAELIPCTVPQIINGQRREVHGIEVRIFDVLNDSQPGQQWTGAMLPSGRGAIGAIDRCKRLQIDAWHAPEIDRTR